MSGKSRKRKEVYMQGTYIANARGFGFVSVKELEQDLFVPEGHTGTALDGDEVEVRLLPGSDGEVHPEGKDGRRQEAEVTAVTVRNTTTLVGTFYGSVIPDNRKIPSDVRIPADATMGAVNGHKVVVRITDYGESGKGHSSPHGRGRASLTGEVIEILGHIDDPGVDILSIMRAYHLPQSFPAEVMEEVREIPQSVVLSRQEGTGREDWRDVLTVTIDGPDTKDIDDAVSIRRFHDPSGTGMLWELGVHIADVAQYVREGTELDKEALKRATSNYLVDRVIPMLPHELSNGICSLNPGEDRFALSCIMQLDRKGKVLESRVAETIIRSDAKLSYPGVMRLFENGDESEILYQLELRGIRRGAKTISHAIAAMLRRGRRLSVILSRKRTADGAIDFEFPECKIHLDEKGRVTDIVPYERNEATMMIENFMVAANETVAERFYWLGVPFVYRSHGVPEEEKLQKLKTFVQGYGYAFHWNSGQVHPRELQTLLAGLKGKPEEATISVMTLRSMQRAMYTTTCGGHFGLALRYYCHFTSPIRRYPDLQIHRIIKEYLHGRLSEKRRSHYDAILPNVCLQSSNMERRADEAERETNKQKMCEFMKGHLGEVFDGSVSGVTGWGIYVQLPNTVEGLVPVRSLQDDYYVYSEEKAQLVGERTGKAYGLGQPVRVSVASVDTMARTIDFELYSEERKAEGKGKGRKAKGRKTKGENADGRNAGGENTDGQEAGEATAGHRHRRKHHSGHRGRKHHAGEH